MFISVVIPTYNRFPILEKCLLALEEQKIFNEINMPKGIVNILHGHGEITGRKLVQNNNVNHIVFTGSPEVASEILKETAERIIPFHLEL